MRCAATPGTGRRTILRAILPSRLFLSIPTAAPAFAGAAFFFQATAGCMNDFGILEQKSCKIFPVCDLNHSSGGKLGYSAVN
jgi:hypothetical protein